MKSIFILGPTATGKTDLALKVASDLLGLGSAGVALLSADSKQVFIGEDIVTGKDKQKFRFSNIKFQKKVKVFGLDLVKPSEDWSVAQFLTYSKQVIAWTRKYNWDLIVVGGTGQYLSSLLEPPATAAVPPDPELRRQLQDKSVQELQLMLEKLGPAKLTSMNNSDRNNPRRLVRAIEVAKAGIEADRQSPLLPDSLMIGLKLVAPKLEGRIRERVKVRIEEGAVEETKRLLQADWSAEARSAIGYDEIESFLGGDISQEQLVDLWTLHELQYAKRQMVWFAKMEGVNWYEADSPNLVRDIASLVENWYTGRHD